MFAIVMLLIALPLPVAAQDLLEVNLIALLDEPRGYCVDMIGYKERARTDRALHAHTCYSYRGSIAVDQGIDRKLVREGRIRFPYFEVCMMIGQARAGEPLVLDKCTDSPSQRFRFTAAGEIQPDADLGLCVTIADGSGAEGGGGQPVHLLRPLSLEPCSKKAASRQRWQLR